MSLTKDEIVEGARNIISGNPEKFIPGETYIPTHGGVGFGGSIWDGDDVAALVDCALSRWYTEGKYSKEFTQQLRLYLDNMVRSVTLCNSGSSANLLAISALTSKEFGERRILPGDEVITTAVGFPTTVNAIVQNKAVPVFVDVDLGTYVPNINTIEEAITEGKTKAIILAHTLGNVFDARAIEDLATEYKIFLISDCCDALGATFEEKHVETYGDMATHSYYPAHHISGGEGGAVLTSNPMIDKVAKSFCSWGRECWCKPGKDNTCGKRFEFCYDKLPKGYDHKYVFSHIGYNLKKTDLQASLLVSQIKRLPEIVQARRDNFIVLHEKLVEFEDWLILPKPTPNSDPSWFGFPITLKSYACCFSRKELIDFLNEHKIGTRMLFSGNLIRQPAYKDTNFMVSGNLYNSDIITESSFWIGIQPSLREEHFDYIADVFRKFFKDKR